MVEAEPGDPGQLSDLERAILAFEANWRGGDEAKEERIRSEFGLAGARYYQLLNAIIDRPEALRHDPMLVNRLIRARDARVRARASRSFGRHDPKT